MWVVSQPRKRGWNFNRRLPTTHLILPFGCFCKEKNTNARPEPAAMALFLQGSLALAKVESAGIRIDENYLNKAIAKTESKIRRLQEEMKADEVYKHFRKAYGTKANLDSPQQLAHGLYQRMG